MGKVEYKVHQGTLTIQTPDEPGQTIRCWYDGEVSLDVAKAIVDEFGKDVNQHMKRAADDVIHPAGQ